MYCVALRKPGWRNGQEGIHDSTWLLNEFNPTDWEAVIPKLIETGTSQADTTTPFKSSINVTGNPAGSELKLVVIERRFIYDVVSGTARKAYKIDQAKVDGKDDGE